MTKLVESEIKRSVVIKRRRQSCAT